MKRDSVGALAIVNDLTSARGIVHGTSEWRREQDGRYLGKEK
jgi:hypothetical protein